MNVRVHKRDFTHTDYFDVDRIKEGSWGEITLEDVNWDELASFKESDVTSIEIRP